MRALNTLIPLLGLLGMPIASAEPPAASAAKPLPAAGQKSVDPNIVLVPDERELRIKGRPGSDLSLTQRIGIKSNQPLEEILLWPGDLTTADKSQTLQRSQIQVMSTDALKKIPPETVRAIDIKVSGLKVPGNYVGALDLLLPEHGVKPALHVPLTVIVEETPKLGIRKGSESLKLQIVNCSSLGCSLAQRLLSSTLSEQFGFPLDNGSVLPFVVTEAAVSASGDAHHLSTGGALSLPSSIPIPPTPIVSIPLTIATNELVPDHYMGDVQLRIPGKEEPLKIPLELNVRSAPTLPILILIVGILLGRFIRYMKDKGTPQSDLLRRFLQIQARAAQNPADLGLLQHMLQQARIDIDAMNLDVATADLTAVENRLTLLSRLRSLEGLLLPRTGEPPVNAILTQIALVRNQISLGADPTATATQIDQAVQNLPPPAGAADPPARALEVAAAASVRGAAPFAVSIRKPPPSSLGRRAIALLTGHSDALRADLTLWFLRPLAWFVLVLLLTVTGFIQLYVKNPIFGADIVGDYFGLLVWAAGADIAGRTLSNFKGS